MTVSKWISCFSVLAIGIALTLSARGSQGKDYHFTFDRNFTQAQSTRLPKALEKWEYRIFSDSYDEAFREAAKACFSHFKKGKRLSETEGLDIIDICANPRG